MILCNMQQDLQTGMPLAVEPLLQTIYGIAFKWELHTTQINWCESMLKRYEGHLALFRKGVCLQLLVSARRIQGDYEWRKWTPVSSPNAAYVIKAFLPSLALKSVWHASDLQCVVINIRSLFWGVGANHYPVAWWKPTVKRFLHRYSLHDVIHEARFEAWVRQGAEASPHAATSD